MGAYEKVLKARNSNRPSGAFFVNRMITKFVEFHGDRRFSDDGAIVGGIGYLNDMPVTIIAMERGDDVNERIKRNFGCPSPEGYRKALRLMKQAEKFNRPVICIINSSGAYCGIGAEERGQGLAIAENLMEMMTLRTPIISVVTGEGGSGGALALSVADSIFMLENAVYSVISPEGCASILWKDSAKADEAAEALKLTANDLYNFDVADKVIEEENMSYDEICDNLKCEILAKLSELKEMPVDELLEKRYQKYRNIGKL
ncbi:MAG: acetyl-CoA carboxylase carboxyltransferase subunit alpha [Monoglobaceae bacterium]